MNNLEYTNEQFRNFKNGKDVLEIDGTETTSDGELIKHFVAQMPKARQNAICPSCQQYNALLFNYYNYKQVILICRNCGFEAIEE